MIKDKKSWLQGLGVGLMSAGFMFYLILLLTGYNNPEKNFQNYQVSDEEVVTRARELGMIYISDMLLKEDEPVDSSDNTE